MKTVISVISLILIVVSCKPIYDNSNADAMLRLKGPAERICVNVYDTPTRGHRLCGEDANLNGVLESEEVSHIITLKL